MAKLDSALLAKAREAYKNPAYRDALNLIAASEGTYNQGADGYNVRFGGNTFSSYDAHPNVSTSYRDRNGNMIPSTAAGRYQFLKGTWDNYAGKLGLTDFSPESQDLAAIALMIDKGAGPAIEKGDLNGIVGKLNNTWTSLPGSTIGAQHHGLRNPAFIAGAYNQSRASHGASPVTFNWVGQSFNDADIPAGYGGRSQVQIPSFTENLLNNMGIRYQQGDFLRSVMSDILGKNYGADPNNIAPSSTLAISADPIASRANLQTMIERLYNTDPNVSYGMGYSNGIRPTITRTNPTTGATQTLIEYPNGIYIDSETGERFTADGQPFVQEAVPVVDNEGLQPDQKLQPSIVPKYAQYADDIPENLVAPGLAKPLTPPANGADGNAATVQSPVQPVEDYYKQQLLATAEPVDALQVGVYADPNMLRLRERFRETMVPTQTRTMTS